MWKFGSVSSAIQLDIRVADRIPPFTLFPWGMCFLPGFLFVLLIWLSIGIISCWGRHTQRRSSCSYMSRQTGGILSSRKTKIGSDNGGRTNGTKYMLYRFWMTYTNVAQRKETFTRTSLPPLIQAPSLASAKRSPAKIVSLTAFRAISLPEMLWSGCGSSQLTINPVVGVLGHLLCLQWHC